MEGMKNPLIVKSGQGPRSVRGYLGRANLGIELLSSVSMIAKASEIAYLAGEG